MIPPVAASERGEAQTAATSVLEGERNALERAAAAGESPLRAAFPDCSGILSRAGHVQSRLNLPGPSGKAEYSRETDSEPVP